MRFPPTSPSSTTFPERPPVSRTSVQSGDITSMPSNMPNPTVGAVLRDQARNRGDHPLLVCDAERLSYAEADRRSADLARALVALGAGKGTHVGLLHPNGAAFVVGMLAAARLGAVVVPFSTFQTTAELKSQLID